MSVQRVTQVLSAQNGTCNLSIITKDASLSSWHPGTLPMSDGSKSPPAVLQIHTPVASAYGARAHPALACG